MDRLKTGALIAVSARVGAILGGASKSDIESITDYGQCLGIAFQIGDDVLDAVGDESKMGKRVRKDAEKQKNSMVRVLGVDGARERARYYIGEAKRAVNKFGERANAVVKLADLVLNRES
jgi:geranylgeranyl pyrophosphate synthase